MPEGPLHTLVRGLRRLADHSGGGLSDAELLERFTSARDQAAFEVLVWRHGPLVLGVCRRLLRQPQDVEDAFQATFLALVRKAASIGNRAAVAGWLYKVAYRAALALRSAATRRASRELPWDEQAAESGPDEVLWRDLRPVLDEEVQRLPEKYRAPFVLCCLEGKSNDEAARQLGCARGTLLSRLARARERLRLRLVRRGVTLSVVTLAAATAERGLAAVQPELASATIRAVLPGAAGQAAVSAQVVALTEGVLQTMFLTKLKTIGAVLLAIMLVGAGVLGSGVFAGAPKGEPAGGAGPTPAAKKAAAQPGAEEARLAKLKAQSANNLKLIGLGLHNYHDIHAVLPAPAIYSKDGKPLLSWRVAILPWMEQGALYQRFKLDEPWDSPHNKQLLDTIPKFYLPVAGASDKVRGGTYYQAFVGKEAAFEPGTKLRLGQIPDGLSNTLFIVEAEALVPWTKPEDLPYVPDQALPRLGGQFGGNFYGLMGDGSVLLFKKDADPKKLGWAITRAGGEVLDLDELLVPRAREKKQKQQLPDNVQDLRRALEEALQLAAAARDEAQAVTAQMRAQVADGEARVRLLKQQNDELRRALELAQRQADRARAELDRLRQILKELAPDKK